MKKKDVWKCAYYMLDDGRMVCAIEGFFNDIRIDLSEYNYSGKKTRNGINIKAEDIEKAITCLKEAQNRIKAVEWLKTVAKANDDAGRPEIREINKKLNEFLTRN